MARVAHAKAAGAARFHARAPVADPLPLHNLTPAMLPRSRAASALPRLLTVEEAAAFLRTSKTTVYRLAGSRRLAYYKLPGRLRFAEADLIAHVANQRLEQVDMN